MMTGFHSIFWIVWMSVSIEYSKNNNCNKYIFLIKCFQINK